MYTYRKSVVRAAFIAVAFVSGACFQLGGCGLGDAAQYIANINPCGSVLNCDPVTYRFIKSGYEGPGADPIVDPSCTYPPFCANDPFVTSQTTQ